MDEISALVKRPRGRQSTLRDPAFLADTKKRQYSVNPVSTKDVTAFVHKVVNTPPELLARLKTAIRLKK